MFPNFVLLFFLNAHNEVLLLRRINTPFCPNHYSLPGAAIEKGKAAKQSLIDEIYHSISILLQPEQLEFVHIMYRKCNEPEFFACIFKAKCIGNDPINREPERHDEMRWFSLDDLPENIVPAHRYAIMQMIANRLYSEHGWDHIVLSKLDKMEAIFPR